MEFCEYANFGFHEPTQKLSFLSLNYIKFSFPFNARLGFNDNLGYPQQSGKDAIQKHGV